MPMRFPHFDSDSFAIRITLDNVAVQAQLHFTDHFSQFIYFYISICEETGPSSFSNTSAY